ncbi:carbohydrate ABC transporter substrate-binding protein [Candidatus Dojkabacteria bacterium]|uniref:Carbohydrate ABC transporter substrate-binding protein n=1 Tax=Candidatus Dojkabacteria bacterium TaxID=2099670 RepID=A0A955L6U2_9BACT|nr:carbohydrate ABC transporter substrate-binding protein [Candidatus Dojkabacteria bacterium]
MKTKFYRTLVLFATVIFTLAACTNGGSGDGTEVTPTPLGGDQQVILIWWNLFEPVENVQPLIDAYETLHPNVTIQYDEKGIDGIDGYEQTISSALSDNDPLTSPDIFTIHNTWAGKYEQYISKAPESIVTQENMADFYPVVNQDFNSNGIVAVPIYLDTLAIIYNKDKLISGGYTIPSDDWSEFQLQAKQLTEKNNNNQIVSGGFSAGIPENSEFYFDMLNLLFLQNGVQMTDESGQAIFADQIESSDAVNFYRTFYTGTDATWSSSFKLDVAAFLESDLAMYAGPSWRLIDILNFNNAFALNLDVGVVPVPQLGGDQSVTWATYWGQTVSNDSTNKEVAWDFINFITQAEQLRLLDQTVKDNGRPVGIIYPRQSMASDISGDEYLGPYVQSLPDAQTWDMYDGFAVKETFDNQIINGSGGLEAIQGIVNQIINSPNTE